MKTFLLFTSCFVLALASNSEDFSSGNQIFTGDLYKVLLENATGNYLFSPFSLETVLALTQSGGKDATSEEIRTTLHLPATNEETETIFRNLLPLVQIQSENYTVQSANKIYVRESFAIREEFKNLATDVYQAGIETVDFVQNVEAAARMNEWVAEKTQNKILDLVDPEELDEYTRLFLINALYFQGTWLYPFKTSNTLKTDFYLSSDKTVSTDMMHLYTLYHNYYESDELDAKFLELSFVNNEASMTIVLPNKKEGLATLEKQRGKLFSAPLYPGKQRVSVAIPKFRIETSIDYNEILQKLGIRTAFNPLEADFSGIAGEKAELYVEKVKQKSFIGVDENGVEAAAATAVELPDRTGSELEFVADHPFLFYIKVGDVVLFEGRVLQPEY